MNGPARTEQGQSHHWRVRGATEADVPALVAGIGELLVELGGSPPPVGQLEDGARALIDDPDAGVVLVAEDGGRIVGVLGASWQSAIRVPGRYGLIQELWVAPAHRDLQVGTALLNELALLARERGIGRLEVGLPGERYPNLAATESFYATNHFTTIGTRMRRLLR